MDFPITMTLTVAMMMLRNRIFEFETKNRINSEAFCDCQIEFQEGQVSERLSFESAIGFDGLRGKQSHFDDGIKGASFVL